MIKALLLVGIVFVGWIAFRACIEPFPFLADYLVYVTWALIAAVAIFAVVLVIWLVRLIAGSRRRG